MRALLVAVALGCAALAQADEPTPRIDQEALLKRIEQKDASMIILDVRTPEEFAAGHVPGAINIPHAKIIGSRLQEYAADTLFVVYCAGPHCNGAARAALRLARQGRPVKLMAGGITGWVDEGFELAREAVAAA